MYPSKLNSSWNAYMSSSSKNLFISCDPNIYNVYTPKYTRGTVCCYSSTPTRQQPLPPDTAIPVDLHVSENGEMHVNYKNFRGSQASSIIPSTSFDDFIAQGPEWSYDLLQHWSSTDIACITGSGEFPN